MKTFLAGACLLLSLAACTSQDPTHAVARQALVPSRSAVCVADSATRLPVKPTECVAIGRSYTHTDISRTGAIDAAQALQQLDPAVTVQYH